MISSKNGFRSSNSSKIASIKNLCSHKAASEPQLLAKIYKMPSKPVFLVARLASLPLGTQERSMSTEDGMDCVLQEFDDGTGESSFGCFYIRAGMFDCIFNPSGLIQVWILLLEQLTAAVSNCPRQHQPPTLELLFTLLREVAVVPGQTWQNPVSSLTCVVTNEMLKQDFDTSITVTAPLEAPRCLYSLYLLDLVKSSLFFSFSSSICRQHSAR